MPAVRRLRLPVPVNIVTGSLASGKTTFIGALLRQKPHDEVWAVLVNEFGAAGLDAALLEGRHGADLPSTGSATATADGKEVDGGSGGVPGSSGSNSGGASGSLDGIHIKQLAGGCLCCALSNVTALAIAQLLRSVKPDRLLIEPSGLAHPTALVDMLQSEHLGPSLALQPVICLVDAAQFAGGAASPACCGVPLLADQISIADVLVGSKADLCAGPALAAFHAWAEGLFPPKHLVITARQGQLGGSAAGTAGVAALLSWPHGAGSKAGGEPGGTAPAEQPEQGSSMLPARRPRQAAASQPWLSSSAGGSSAGGSSAGGSSAGGGSFPASEEAASRDRPLRKQVQDGSGAHAACGWIFHRDCMFDRARLQALLQLLVPLTLRLKGVFRVSRATWVAASAAPGLPAAAAAEAAAAGGTPAAAVAAPPAVELHEIAYRRDSRVEVILDVAAAAAAGSSAADSDGSSAADSLEQQTAQLGLDDGSGKEQQVAAALRRAAAGDWACLEALLQHTLAS